MNEPAGWFRQAVANRLLSASGEKTETQKRGGGIRLVLVLENKSKFEEEDEDEKAPDHRLRVEGTCQMRPIEGEGAFIFFLDGRPKPVKFLHSFT